MKTDKSSSMKMLFFDIDGVVLYPRKERFDSRLHRDYCILPEAIHPLFVKDFYDCVAGKNDLKKLLKEKYLSDWGWQGSVDELLDYWWEGDGKVNEELLREIAKYREKGHLCYLVMDQEKYRAIHLLKDLDLESWFDGFFLSSEIGVRRTTKTYWNVIFKKLGINNSDDVVCFDDEQENIVEMKDIGIDARLFTTVENFKIENII